MRNYTNLVQRINTLSHPYLHRRVLGEVEGYPIFCITLSLDDSLPTMLINAGTHGDEPAGVAATLAFLDQDHTAWLEKIRFEVSPCLNPRGYAYNTRHNTDHIDINWAYTDGNVPEVRALRNFIADRQFKGIIDLHEDIDSPGYYLYEQRRNGPQVGPEIIRRVSTACPVNMNPCIEGDAAVNGVIHPNAELKISSRGHGIPLILFQQNTDHYITSETPTKLSMNRRVQAHLTALHTMIEAHAQQSRK